MDPLTLGYVILLVVGIFAVVKWPKSRLVVAAALLGVAGWFGWAFCYRYSRLETLSEANGSGFIGMILLIVYAAAFLLHLAAAVALAYEVLARRNALPESTDELDSPNP